MGDNEISITKPFFPKLRQLATFVVTIFFTVITFANQVGGEVTAGITDQNLLSGHYVFDQASPYNGTVINKGTIIASQNGLVALIGSNVSNEGVIQANLGSVVLASGSKFTVDLAGDGLVSFTV